jgi:hypothetical protein
VLPKIKPKSNAVLAAVRSWISYSLRVLYPQVIVLSARREAKPVAAGKRDAIHRLAQEMEFAKDDRKNECEISSYR